MRGARHLGVRDKTELGGAEYQPACGPGWVVPQMAEVKCGRSPVSGRQLEDKIVSIQEEGGLTQGQNHPGAFPVAQW